MLIRIRIRYMHKYIPSTKFTLNIQENCNCACFNKANGRNGVHGSEVEKGVLYVL